MARLDRTWTVEAEGSPLATELHRVLEVSHRQAKGLIDAACVKVNGEVASTYGLRLAAGDRVAVKGEERSYQPLPKPRKGLAEADWKVLWEDKHLLFVEKAAGLLTVPTETSPEPSLADAIKDQYRRRGFKHFQLYIVHRLDRHTSGVLVFAKTSEALHHLKDLFAEHKLQRVYKAILVGELPENAGTLTDRLVERARSMKMAVLDERKKEPKGAQKAVTHYRVVERLPGHTVVEVRLETGRRNQIRVQFAERGFPLLGDQVYGAKSSLIERQALHAELLGVKHPETGEMVSVTCPLPKDLEAALRTLRLRRRVERAEEGRTGAEGIYQPRATREKRQAGVARARKFEEMEAASGSRRAPREGGEREERPRPRPRPAREGQGESRPGSRPFKPRAGVRRDGEGEARGERPRPRPRPARAGQEEGRPASRPFKPRTDVRRDGEGEARGERPRPRPRPAREGQGEGRPGSRPFKPRAGVRRDEEGDTPRRPAARPRTGARPGGSGRPASQGKRPAGKAPVGRKPVRRKG